MPKIREMTTKRANPTWPTVSIYIPLFFQHCYVTLSFKKYAECFNNVVKNLRCLDYVKLKPDCGDICK